MENDLKIRVEDFFKSLIERTGTYFLSDYVEDISDFLTPIETLKVVEKRNALKAECEAAGLNLHEISCDVASDMFYPPIAQTL